MELTLKSLPGIYTIHRFPQDHRLDEAELNLARQGFCSITSTGDEVSVVCRGDAGLNSPQSSPGWKCLRVPATLRHFQDSYVLCVFPKVVFLHAGMHAITIASTFGNI